jgi:sterol desaturase/sphingolipid hydroxylase (fatty acid hydroxylase superfamily)
MDSLFGFLLELAHTLGKAFAIYACVALAIHIAERRWPAGPPTSMRDQLFNFLLAFAVSVCIAGVNSIAPLTNIIADKLGVQQPLFSSWKPATVPGWIAGALMYAFLWDFLQYWFHRLQHSLRPLWFMHALHHDSDSLNSTDAVRNTLWSGIVQGVFIGVPMLALGAFSLLHTFAGIVLFSVWGFYNHANIRAGHGLFTVVVSGPQFHRIHHAVDPVYHNKNFAAFFPLIDVVFGTYQAPMPGRFPATGLTDRPHTRGSVNVVFAAMIGMGSQNRPTQQ